MITPEQLKKAITETEIVLSRIIGVRDENGFMVSLKEDSMDHLLKLICGYANYHEKEDSFKRYIEDMPKIKFSGPEDI